MIPIQLAILKLDTHRLVIGSMEISKLKQLFLKMMPSLKIKEMMSKEYIFILY